MSNLIAKGVGSLKARRPLWAPLLVFLVTRLGIAAVAYFSTPILADSNVPPYHIRPDNLLIDTFASRWDTGFYLSIVDEGYSNTGDPFPSTAFFPLMPILMRIVRGITGDSLISGLLVANLSLAAASILLYRLAADEFDEDVALRAVWYLLIFPTSFFGSAIYTESLFLLVCILALFLARRGFWWAAGLAGYLAGLTRFVGLIITPMLVAEWFQQWRISGMQEGKYRRSTLHWTTLLTAGLTPLGTLTYMLYLKWKFNDPLAFLHASSAWARAPRSPLALIGDLFITPAMGWKDALLAGALPLDNWLDLIFVASFIGLGIVLCVQRRWSEGLFVLLGATIPLGSGLLMSQRRYMWVLFPVFILLARWGRNAWLDRIILTFFLLGLGLFTALFANWYWVG